MSAGFPGKRPAATFRVPAKWVPPSRVRRMRSEVIRPMPDCDSRSVRRTTLAMVHRVAYGIRSSRFRPVWCAQRALPSFSGELSPRAFWTFEGEFSAFRRARGVYGRTALISDTVLPLSSSAHAVRLSGQSPLAARTRGSPWSAVGDYAAASMEGHVHSRQNGSLSAGSACSDRTRRQVCWNRVPSAEVQVRPASVRETPNGVAPGCVPGRRTRPIAGPW